MREHSLWASSWGEEGGLSFGTAVWWRHIPSSGLRHQSAAVAAGEELGLSGEVSTSVMVRVSSKADSLTGTEATTRPIFGERL